MINPISAAMGGVSTALEQFDRALLSTVTAVEEQDGGAGSSGPVEVPDGLAGMDTARLAVQAAIAVANASISMLDDVLKLGDYDHRQSDSSGAQAASSSAQEDPSRSVQLMALLQTMQARESAQPEAPQLAAAPPSSEGSAQTE
jgi:hypothetical protein